MRIKILQTATMSTVDGIDLTRFRPGQMYEVGNVIGALLIVEGWAEPVASDERPLVIPLSEFAPDAEKVFKVSRKSSSLNSGSPVALAADRPRRSRPRRN